jgi:putative NADH-flavin reductase
MKAMILGATGMVGQGVLRECLPDPAIEMVLKVGRSRKGTKLAKLREISEPDLFHYSDIEAELRGFDACVFCLGVSSVGAETLSTDIGECARADVPGK